MKTPEDLCVTMVNHDLSGSPEAPLPETLSLHWYESGDEARWLAIHEAADKFNEITPELFRQEFSSGPCRLEDRQCFLLTAGGEAVATGTAWAENEGCFAGYGRVHWIAVVPAWQGKGIGTALMSVVCRRLLRLGHRQAFLLTSTRRPAAISLYEKFGFEIESTGAW